MELEQLKTIWKEAPPAAPEAALEALLRQRSRSPIAKMKRNLLAEVVLLVASYTWFVVYSFTRYKGSILVIPWMLLLLGFGFLYYYFRKYQLLRKMECVSCEIKSNLQLQLQQIQSYIRFYIKAGAWLFSMGVFIGGLFALFSNPDAASNPLLENTKLLLLALLVLVVITAVLTIPLYFLNKWYAHLLYGQHLQKLQNIVNEISETEAPASNS